MKLLARIRRIFHRPPDFCIGGADNPYIRRWWVIPRNRYFNIYLHNQMRDDDDRALHDHPWCNISIIFKGGYIEHRPLYPQLYPEHDFRVVKLVRWAPCIVFRRAICAHRLELHKLREYVDDYQHPIVRLVPSWSIFITGPKIRDWGFWCGSRREGWRWVPWQIFTDPDDSGKTGKGCEQ